MTRISVIVLCTTFLAAPTHAGEHRNFVSCPLVRDTKTVPCWLAEHDGELYYLGIQTDISADFDPPYLGHRALVEGVVAPNAERICGGIVLDPVNVSTLPELDGACNTVLPAEDRYQVPFAPRPPGPSGGRLAFEPPPGAAAAKPALTGPQEFAIEYDFDTPIMARHADVLTQIFGYATQAHARHIVVRGYRGATLLSDGTVMTERDTLPEARAKEVAQTPDRRGSAARGGRGQLVHRGRTAARRRRLARASHRGPSGALAAPPRLVCHRSPADSPRGHITYSHVASLPLSRRL
jgi:hypothetical protein